MHFLYFSFMWTFQYTTSIHTVLTMSCCFHSFTKSPRAPEMKQVKSQQRLKSSKRYLQISAIHVVFFFFQWFSRDCKFSSLLDNIPLTLPLWESVMSVMDRWIILTSKWCTKSYDVTIQIKKSFLLYFHPAVFALWSLTNWIFGLGFCLV